MIMNQILDKLFSLQDNQYASFQLKLIPGIKEDSVIGVRIPLLRDFAKQLVKDPAHEEFLKTLPHSYYDENILHGLLVSQIKDFDICIACIESFLPYIDNWAVCDTISPKIFGRNREQLLHYIYKWIESKHVYTCRFGLRMLMNHFLDEDFRPEYLQVAASVRGEDYYIKMMVAWFFATALAKQWEATLPFIEQNKLENWIHLKTIQKACESFRITPAQKQYLKTQK